MADAAWDTLRNGLIAGGTLMSATGWFEASQVAPFVDNILALGGGAVVIGTFVWTIWVKFRTKAVPKEIGDLPHIPTVSPVTGKVEMDPISEAYTKIVLGDL